jgi:hypothetical protein
MAQSRLLLQSLLEEILGTEEVYFQPPENLTMQYPAIIYTRSLSNTQFADNHPYRRTKRYLVTVIDQDPDSLIPDKVAELPMCTHSRSYPANQLHHDVFDVYF